jgi:hypothetical protein
VSDAPIVYEQDGKVIYRASALGGCTKALVAARLGYEASPTPEGMQKTFRAGHDAEEVVKAELRSRGWVISNEQAEVTYSVSGKLRVVGHIDGVGSLPLHDLGVPETLVGIEIKSQNQEEWDRFGREGWTSGFWSKYRWQISVYALALQIPFCIVRFNRDDPNVESRLDITQDIPFCSPSDIAVRVLDIERQARNGKLPTGCDTSLQFPCPYFRLHEDDREIIDDQQVEDLATIYEGLKRVVAQAERDQEEARKTLRDMLGTDGKFVTRNGTKISFYQQNNPPRLNVEKLREFLKEAGRTLEEFQTTTSSERLRITIRKTEEDGGDGGGR